MCISDRLKHVHDIICVGYKKNSGENFSGHGNGRVFENLLIFLGAD